jgi:hypothetical protein
VSHGLQSFPSSDDVGDLEGRERLAMTLTPTVVLAPAKLEHDKLGSKVLRDDFRLDLGAADQGPAKLEIFATHEENLIEGNAVADVPSEFLDPKLVTPLDSVLFAAGLEHRIHGKSLWIAAARSGGGRMIGRRSIGAPIRL